MNLINYISHHGLRGSVRDAHSLYSFYDTFVFRWTNNEYMQIGANGMHNPINKSINPMQTNRFFGRNRIKSRHSIALDWMNGYS